MSGTSAYHLTIADRALTHGRSRPRLLRDHEEYQPLDIDALVASGDCFITIATSLDDSTRLLKGDDKQALPQIEKNISVLMYLQRNYHIVRKHPDHRQ